jgi:hypothetical protein
MPVRRRNSGRVPANALHPEHAREPHAARHRHHRVQLRRRIDDEIAGRKLRRLPALQAVDDQLAAIVVGGIGQEERARQVGAQRLAPAHQRAVDVHAVGHARRIAVHQRRRHASGKRGLREHRVARKRLHSEGRDRAAVFAVLVDLLVALRIARFAGRGVSALEPRRTGRALPQLAHFGGGQDAG